MSRQRVVLTLLPSEVWELDALAARFGRTRKAVICLALDVLADFDRYPVYEIAERVRQAQRASQVGEQP